MGSEHSAAMRILSGIGVPLIHPAVAFPLEKVPHGHGAGAARTFGRDRHGGIGFIPAEDHGGDADVHRSDVQTRAAGEVIEHALPDSAFIADIVAAAGERQKDQQGEETSHALIIPVARVPCRLTEVLLLRDQIWRICNAVPKLMQFLYG